jgi:RNA polymerase sigma factor (sigma-70 family)
MLVPALRVKEPTFREGIANYVTAKCRPYRVPRVDVDDIKQEALAQIIAKVDTFQPEKSEFEQWARGIAWNVIREYLRKAKLYFALFTEYHPNVHDYATEAPSPERCARRKQAQCRITSAAQSLSSREVNVLILHVVNDMPHREVGHELKMSESASQKCYQRARNRLAECISGDAFSVMPPSLTSCNEPVSFNENGSRWAERSHYAGQIIATIIALLPFVPACIEPQTHESKSGEARCLAPVQNESMYSSDKRLDEQDEPAMLEDALSGKPAPASLPSAPAVPALNKFVVKPAPLRQSASEPLYKPTLTPVLHSPPVQRIEH